MLRVLSATLGVMVVLAGMSVADEIKLSGDNTKITFVGTKPQGKHNGGFKTVTGTASFTGTDATTLKISAEIDVNSIYTDTDKLTNHLKSPDFFDAKNNPTAKFESTKVEKSGDSYKVTGKLTMHGKTKEISFPAKIDIANDKVTLSSEFKINRHDWGISYGKGMVDDDVALKVSVEAKK
jgi:polyisoprenoid-binding protein YceI